MRKNVIIDCDVGVDDALALILAFHSPELKVKAVTGVNGNVPLDFVFENIKKVLSLIQPNLKPSIARGADRPLKGNPIYAFSVHGRDGLGEARVVREEEEEWWHVMPDHASNLITKMAHDDPDKITLIATGPLTNLALALRQDADGMKKLKEVVIMGGAVRTEGNITSFAEFNIFVDPLAAKEVLESGLPMTLVPLDVTHKVYITPVIIEERVKVMDHPFSQFLIEATGYDFARRRFRGGVEVFHLHDPLAVGATVEPDLVREEKLSIQVEAEEGERYGQTAEVPPRSSGEKSIDVCLEVDSKRFVDLFLSRLA